MVEVADIPDIEAYADILATCACLQLRKATRVVTRLYDEALRRGSTAHWAALDPAAHPGPPWRHMVRCP